jgi:hypothetical protein
MIVRGWDSDGMGCGYNETTKDYPALYWAELPDQQVINNVLAGNFSSVLTILNKGVCVKECPGVDKSVPVDCHPTSYMMKNTKYYSGCNYYPGGVSSGYTFRYATTQVGGFCMPAIDQLANSTAA